MVKLKDLLLFKCSLCGLKQKMNYARSGVSGEDRPW